MSLHPTFIHHREALLALTSHLLDDAAIFPPGDAPMTEAVDSHFDWHAGEEAFTVGPFVCSLGRLGELSEVLEAKARVPGRQLAGLQLAVVVPPGSGDFSLGLSEFFGEREERAPQGEPAVRLTALEVTLGPEELARSTLSANLDAVVETLFELSGLFAIAPAVFVELPALPVSAEHLEPLAVRGLQAKFRTGGVVAEAFPSEIALGRAMAAAVDAGITFKCTAGLHRAVRHRGEDGFEHHGFCNVLVATKRAIAGAELEAVVEALGVRDGHRLAEELFALEPEKAADVRRSFSSFGTCSIDEPLQDLRRLGLLA